MSDGTNAPAPVVPAADGAASPAPETAPAPVNGAEARIAELTRQNHELQRQNAETQREMMERLAEITTRLASQPVPTAAPQHYEPPPEPEFSDPEVGRYLKRQQAMFDAQLRANQQQMAQQIAVLQFQTVAANQPPAVVKRAQELWMAWQKSGHTGWTPKDAITYARGELGDVDSQARAKEANTFGRVVEPPLASPGFVPQISQPTQPQGLPANYDSLSLDEQIAIGEKLGLHNLPL